MSNKMDSKGILIKQKEGSFYDLLNFDDTVIDDCNITNAISCLEKKFPSLPKETIKNNILLFYLISIINNKIPFILKGGFIMQYYLNDNLRPTRDLDLITYLDSDSFYKLLKDELDKYEGNLSFNIKEYYKSEVSKSYFYNIINLRIDVMYKGNHYHELLIDGISVDFYDKIDSCDYQGLKAINNDFRFKGVKVEYVMAEKIMAITNELVRPYKHLIDVYSIIQRDIDLDLLKKYLNIILEYDNRVRAELNFEKQDYKYLINDNKVFSGNYILPCLQAGYNLRFEKIKEEVNDWLKNNL